MNTRAIAALVRASWRTALSYRLRSAVSLLSLLIMIVPLYFISRAVQPIMAPVIANEGVHYFAFLTVGLFASIVVSTCVRALPDTISSDLNSGFFEALVSTPAGSGSVAVGLSSYAILRDMLRGVALVLAGALLGIHLVWARLPEALLIVALIALAHFGVGLIAGALVVAFRTHAAIPQVALLASGLLGGVYYPTTVIPAWIQNIADVVPLAYGLRALRHTLLDGQGIQMVLNDLGVLAAFSAVLLATGAIAYRAALQYARQAGSLSQ
ncbi:MAG TPA: ABC transporter permease, partial [Gemmatimonadaceae bacterium]|nr:ABC transporter permease [Gemmatimonadaceae bacterium]